MKVPWKLVRLPPFPQIATRVLQLVSKDVSSLPELSTLIASDQAFSSEVLTIVNSPLYPLHAPVTSILQAIATLGFDRLRGLAVTVGVRAYLGGAMTNPALRAVWRHSLACALLAEEYAAVGLVNKETAYTAGIMHDIGRVALAAIRPEEYAEFLQSVQEDAVGALSREKELFEFNHCELGRRLVLDWRLPSQFMDVTAHHHRAEESVEKLDLLGAICSCCKMADAIGFAASPSFKCCYEELLGQIPKRARDLFPPSADDLVFRIGTKINSIEAAY
jgi:putative nucleotidyltransferase with HDIG domain